MDDKPGLPSGQEEVNGHQAESAAPRKRGVMNTLYPPRPGGGGRLKNHCRKFWWCDLLVIAVIVLVIVLPIVYVAIPNKAQHDLNESTLNVTSQDVSNPAPNSVHLKLVSVAKSSSSFHPTLEGFNASLSLKDLPPFIYLSIPETKAEATTDITVDQDVPIADMEQFINYNKVVMGSESFDIYLDGKTKIHQSGLKGISANYNKVITMKGLNKLQGLNITGIRILDKNLADGSNMVGNVSIPNPSVMTLSLGNVTMNLAVDGKSIGYSLIPDMILKPGDNLLPMQSTVSQGTVISLITSKYKDAILPLSIVGNSSVKDGQHLEYYEAAIKSNTINLNLNVGPALEELGLNLTSLGGT